MNQARAAFLAFLANIGGGARAVVFHDVDADGIAAAVVLTAALERSGRVGNVRLPSDRVRNAWTEQTRERIRRQRPQALFVLDLGSRQEPVLSGVPNCFMDHHRPGGCPPGDVLISGYGWQPAPTTSLLVHWVVEQIADLRDLEWVTALGILSDLGENAPFGLLRRVKKGYTAKWLKEATVLGRPSGLELRPGVGRTRHPEARIPQGTGPG